MAVNDEVHVFAKLQAKSGEEAALRDVLQALVSETQKEPGVLTYMLHEDNKAAGRFFVFEVYKDQSAAESHMSSPHLAAALGKAGPLLGAPPEISQTRLLAGH